MKIYFTASIVGKKQFLSNYQSVVSWLKKNSHSVQADHILNTSEDQIRIQDKKERLAFHSQLKKWISACDAMIVEASFPSISVGYEISLAIKLGKPVLILYSDGDAPSLFSEYDEAKVICEQYSKENLGEILNYFTRFINEKHDLRYTFLLPSDLAQYLDEVSHQAKIPKSSYIRLLIQEDMKMRR